MGRNYRIPWWGEGAEYLWHHIASPPEWFCIKVGSVNHFNLSFIVRGDKVSSPLIHECSTNSLLHVELDCSCLLQYLTELPVYKTTRQLLCSSHTAFLCLPFVCTHSLGLSGTVSSAKLDQTHIVLIIFEISPLQVVLLTLWVCVCVHVHPGGSLFWLCFVLGNG